MLLTIDDHVIPKSAGMAHTAATAKIATVGAAQTHRHILHQHVFGLEPLDVGHKHGQLAVAAGQGAGGRVG